MATFTYNEATNKEDLSDIITNLSPADTPVTSMIGKAKAKATYHEFPEDELLPADPNNAYPEGYTYAPKPVQGRARNGNYTQIFIKEFTVSKTQQAVDTTGVANEYAYQMTKAMKQLGKDLEVAILNNTVSTAAASQVDFQTAITTKNGRRVFGGQGSPGTIDYELADAYQGGGVKPNTGTVRKLSGLQDLIYTVKLAGGPTVENITAALQTTWMNGGNPSKLVVSPAHKTVLSAWTEQGNPRVTLNKNMADRKLVQAVDVYESDFGKVELIPSRYLINQEATDPITGKVLNFDLSGVSFVLDPNYIKLAWLRPFKKEQLPNLASAKAAVIEGEVTLEVRGERAQAIITGKYDGGGGDGGDDSTTGGGDGGDDSTTGGGD